MRAMKLALALACLALAGCDKSGSSSNNPSVVDTVASDVEGAVTGAPDAAEGVADDVGSTVDGVTGSNSSPPASAAPADGAETADDDGEEASDGDDG